MSIEIKHTEYAKGRPEDVWYYWSNTDTWDSWDHGVEWCKLKEGEVFALGAKALLLPKGAPEPVDMVITECVVNRRFVDEGVTQLGKIIVSHEVKKCDQGIEITHAMLFEPANEKMKDIFMKSLHKSMTRELPAAVKALSSLVEKRSVCEV